ncbi:metal transporter CNNM4-like protein [Leptotrombidium deliense]|uniref:Metal transporter CNNM4-like protein n=1 Tax=Leptotrombidium deliense TaxID=299467 RepID=A0A443SED6_9ACAR|nr:metal transporter CNNM4-like protein [Leptotrombidium deliense]
MFTAFSVHRLLVLVCLVQCVLCRHLLSQPVPDTSPQPTTLSRSAVDTFHSLSDSPQKPVLIGIKAEGEKVSVDEDGTIVIQALVDSFIRLFGVADRVNVTFTRHKAERGADCNVFDHSDIYLTEPISEGVSSITVSLPGHKDYYYICVLENKHWIHQGTEPWMRVRVATKVLPVTLQVLIILLMLTLSGLFSGLNLGLMALDKNELQVISRCGTEDEKRHALAIEPVRKRGNYLLCTLLLGNVLVNSTLTILLDDLTSGIIAVIGSTLSIVIFGEIIPQAICSRHGLAVGARTIYLTYLFMVVTFPLSYPISKILDRMLGDEIGNVYDRERLMEYIKVTKTYNKLEEDEVNIISGALALKTRTVGEVMTRLEDVFMLPESAVLDFQTVSEIQRQGYSRIPVYRNNERRDIIALLHAKDLAFVDPDDIPPTPLKTLIDYYKHPLIHTFEDETLNNVLNHFKQGKSHMAFVVKIYGESEDVDPYHEITGIITLEDVIEEILQAEIVDETDIITDNRKKQKRKEIQVRQDFSDFAKIGEGNEGYHVISPQMALATFQYLSTAVEPFSRQFISQVVLRRLIAQKVYYNVRLEEGGQQLPENVRILYTAGKAADYFIMILEGRVQVIVGKESLEFESGPFTYFGVAALKLPEGMPKVSSVYSVSSGDGAVIPKPPSPDMSMKSPSISVSQPQGLSQQSQSFSPFVPDYTVRLIETTLYMKVPRNVYMAAYHASLVQKQKDLSQDDERFKEEVDSAFTTSLIDRTTTPESKRNSVCVPPVRRESVDRTNSSKPSAAVTAFTSNHVQPIVPPRTATSSRASLPSYDETLPLNSSYKTRRLSPGGDAVTRCVGNGSSSYPPSAESSYSPSPQLNDPLSHNRSLPPSPRTQKRDVSRQSSRGSLAEDTHLIGNS